MSKRIIIPYNKKILRWAREEADVSIETVAKRIFGKDNFENKIERIKDWEDLNSTDFPTEKQGRKLAKLYDFPFMNFFLDTPPKVAKPRKLIDYRKYTGSEFIDDSKKLSKIQIWAEAQRTNALDLYEMLNVEVDNKISKFRNSIESFDDVEKIAKLFREEINFPRSKQKQFKANDDNKFKDHIKYLLEEHGILILKENDLDKYNVRGVCINFDTLPVIVFNGKDAPKAQIFTLIHELGHIIYGKSGINGYINKYDSTNEAKTEKWCNDFAASFLIPYDDISDEVMEYIAINPPLEKIEDNILKKLANRYCVSEHAMLIRLVNLKIVKAEYYWNCKLKQFRDAEKKLKEKKGGGGNNNPPYGKRFLNKFGMKYTSLVIDAFNQGLITNHNAAEFMEIKRISHFDEIRMGI